MTRNIKILIAVILILLVLIGIILWRALVSPEERAGFLGGIFGGSLPEAGPEAGGLPPLSQDSLSVPLTGAESRKLVQLSREPVIGATIKPGENKVMYFKLGEGKLYEAAFNGEAGENKISNITIKDIVSVLWSKSKTYSLLTTYFDDTKKHFWMRRTSTSTVESGELAGEILSAAFAPKSEELAVIVRTSTASELRIMRPDGTKPKTVLRPEIPDFDVYWIADKLLALKTRTSGLAPSLLETVSTSGGAPTVVTSGAYGLDIIWSPDGSRYLASGTTEGGKRLAMAIHERSKPDILTEFAFATLPEKCAFSDKEKSVVYCAAPRTLGTEPLPDAWWQGRVSFEDTLWKINTETGQTSMLLEGGGFDMTNIFTSPGEEYLFFTNKKDSSLWSLKTLESPP